MSAQKLITEHLDLWTGAITKKSTSGRSSNGKIELTGIKKLRELILDLAIRGFLVDQDPSDEPAQEQLERCLKAKSDSINQGKLKKARKHADIRGPFGIPEGWVWSRLDDLVRVINGRAYKKHEMLSSGTPLLRVGNLFTSNDWYYSDLELEEDKYIDSGDLIYAWSASFGPFIWDGGRAIYHYHIWKLDLFDEEAIDKWFLYLYLKAITEEIKSSGNGIAMIHMTKASMEKLVVPIPPLEEQHRIVQKVDELMALCDRLEQQTSDQLDAHETLVDTLLGTLTQSENATELANNWARLAAHFDALFTTEQSIDKLKQTILQLAVMGRLVEQNAEGESTSRLFDRVYSENGDKRSRLLDRSQTSCDSHLPPGWDYAVLPEVTENKKYSLKRGPFGSALKKAFFKANGFKVYEQQHAINNDFSRGEYYIDEDKFTELKAFEVKPGDLIISCSGTVGRVAEAPTWMEPGIINQALLKLSLDQRLLTNDYFKILFPAFFLETDTLQNLQGTAQKNMVSMDTLKKEAFPMPPLEEQQRIVQKVDELTALCDQLKDRLNQASETRCQLAEALVEQGLSA